MPYLIYLVISKNLNKIFLGNADSNADWHRFDIGPLEFTREHTIHLDFLPLVSMIHSFSPNKHFVIYSDLVTYDIYYGISADTNPLSQNAFANASYFDTAEKPIYSQGTAYYSLNDVFDNLETVVLFSGEYKSSNDCTGDKLFVFVGSIKNCKTACPAGKSYVEAVQSNWLCRTACYHENSWMYDTNKCVSGTCISSGFKEYGPVENKECTVECENAYKYLNGNNCGVDCPYFMTPTENAFSDTTERGDCVATCNSPKFRLTDPTILYPDNKPRQYCLDECDARGQVYYETVGETNTCVKKCQTNHFLDLRSFVAGFTLPDLEPADPQKECLSTCLGYKLYTDFTFYDSSSKNYCLGGCPDNYYTNEQNSTDKTCIVDCSLALLNIYATPDKKCVSDCSTTNYPFSREDTKQCLDACLSSSTHKFTTPDDICVPSCSATPDPYFRNTAIALFCVSSCTNMGNVFREVGAEKECVVSCNGDFIKLVSEPSPLTEDSITSSSSIGKCVSSCTDFVLETSETYPLVVENKVFCLSACPEGMSVSIQNGVNKCISECTYPFPYRTPTGGCSDDCFQSGYRFSMEDFSCSDECSGVIDSNTMCLSSCPVERPLVEDNHCTAACSSLNPFILDFYECVSECPSKAFDNLCVTDCNDEEVFKFYSDQAKTMVSKPFTLSTKVCSVSCTESNFKFALEDSLECVSRCPETGMKYSDSNQICRINCSETEFPFKDEETRQCLKECLPERPLVLLESKECVDKCPSSNPFLFSRANCDNSNICDSDCTNRITECRPNCPSEAKFKLETAETVECYCTCPLFYLLNDNLFCELNCDNSIGLIQDDSKQTCLHCRDNLEKVLFNADCVEECPRGYIPDKNGVCKTCFELDLWHDDSNRCMRFEECDSLSHFFYPTKLCSECVQPGFKILIEQGKQPKCAKTDCSEGHIETESSITFCYICLSDHFFHKGECRTTCPADTNYSFQKFKCTDSCFPECTTACCVNGKCNGNKCQCETGFTGDRCDLEVSSGLRIKNYSTQFLTARLRSRLLTLNESYVLDDIASLEHHSARRSLTKSSITDFIDRILSLIDIKHVEYSFNLRTFTTLDRLLGLALNLPFSTKKQDSIQSIIGRIDQFSQNIQIFNTKVRAEPDFEQVFKGSFQGRYFSFSFGPGTKDISAVNINDCLSKVRTSLNTGSSVEFPYTLLEFTAFASNHIERDGSKAFTLAESPLMELYLFTSLGPIDLNTICPKFYADYTFIAALSTTEVETAVALKERNFDVFNKNDSLFLDKCVKFTSNNTDLTLKERREAYFIDPKEICNEKYYNICTVKLVNNQYKCVCRGIREKRKSTLEEIAGTYPDTNFNLIYCYNTFVEANLTFNPTLYVLLPLILASWLLSYLFMGYKDETLVKRDFNELIRQAVALYDPETMNETAFFKECFQISKRLKKLKARASKHAKSAFKNAYKYIPTVPDLNKLAFEQLIKFDTRSNFQFALDTLMEEHSIFNALLKKRLPGSPLFPIMVFFTEIVLNISLNAFFIEDNMIQRKNEEGSPSIWTAFSADIVARLWIVATTKLVISTLTVVTPSNEEEEKTIIQVILRDKTTATIKFGNNHRLEQRTRMILFMLFCAGLQVVCVYFLVIFNEIYENSTNVWVMGVCATLLLEWLIVETIVPVALISTRTLSKHFESTIGAYRWAFKLKKLPRLKDMLEF